MQLGLDSGVRGALINGAVVLIAAFVGVWGGREAVMAEQRAQQKQIEATAELVSKLAIAVNVVTIQVEKLGVASANDQERIRALEQWRIDISDLASKRGVEIPDLRRRVESLERSQAQTRRP